MPTPDDPGAPPPRAPCPTRRPRLLTLRRSFWGALSLAAWRFYGFTLRRILPLDLALRPPPPPKPEPVWTLVTAAFRVGTLGPHLLIECRTCGARSYHLGDVENRFCGRCRRFLDEPE